MKRILCCLITCVILLISITPCSIFAENTNDVTYEIFENFENPSSEWNFKQGSIARLGGYGLSGGDCGAGSFPTTENFRLISGKTYKISGWIYVESNFPASALKEDGQNIRIQWYHNGSVSDGIPMKDTKTTLKYLPDEWQYFQMAFLYNGAVDITTEVWLQIMSAPGYVYRLDDYAVTVVDEGGNEVSAEFVEPIYHPEIEEISAKVYTENPDETLLAIASYSETGKMEQVTIAESFDGNEATISVPNVSSTEKVKVFAFDKNNSKPLMEEMLIEKQNDASYVFVNAKSGNDSNPGSFNQPVKTITRAMVLAENAIKADGTGDVNIMLKAGEHIIDNAIQLDSSVYSGKKQINFASYGGGRAQISGGEHITGWQIFDEEKNIYKATIFKNRIIRQMYINGIHGTKARSKGPLTGAKKYTASGDVYGFTCSDTNLADFKRPSDMELVFEEVWSHSYSGVSNITEENGITYIIMDNPGGQRLFNKGDITATLPVYYQNALELLDEPGEWYYNVDTGEIYYMPRHFEDINTADIVVPDMLGTKLSGSSDRWNDKNISLVYMAGTADNPVDNVSFTNIDFAYSSYQVEPTGNSGYSSAQANFLRHGNDSVQQGAFHGQNVRNITIKGCSFSKLGSTALCLLGAVQDCNIVGNEFHNLAATAIHFGDIKDATAVNYDKTSNPTPATNPPEEKYEVKNVVIENNYIHDVGNDYKGAVGISCGFPKDSVIRNNEICDVPYSGMHLGYGWAEHVETGTNLERLIVENNYVHHVMNSNLFDGGGIYTLGMTGGDAGNLSYVRENYITHVENDYAALYMDNSSSYWSFNDNVVDLSETPLWYRDGKEGRPSSWILIGAIENRIFNNYTTTPQIHDGRSEKHSIYYQPGIVYSPDAPPKETERIIEKSGLKGIYKSCYAASVQNVDIPAKYDISSGESVDLLSAITATERKGVVADLSNAKVYFRSINPEIAQVDSYGMVTGVISGKAEIETIVVMGETAEVLNTTFYVGDRADKLIVPQEEVHITTYSNFDLQAKAESLFGQILKDYPISYTSSNTAVVNVSDEGVVSGVTTGEATVKVSTEIGGTTQEKTVTIKVIGSNSTEKYVLDTELDDETKWADDNSYDIFKIDSGISMTNPRHAGIYEGRKFMDETIKCKMKWTLNGSGLGPIIRASDSRGDTGYRFAINDGKGRFQLSRGNTYLTSSADNVVAIDGSTEYDVEVSAVNEANGVRLRLLINGEEVINFLDENENAIREAGYFGVVARYGTVDILKGNN